MVALLPGFRLDGPTPAYLGTTQAVLYTIPPSGIGRITGIALINETATDKTVNMFVKRKGVTVRISPVDYVIPGGSLAIWSNDEIDHYLAGGDADTIEGYASSATSVKYLISMKQRVINT